MNSLRQFREQIEIADQPIGEEYMAYRMDGGRRKRPGGTRSKRPDMRLKIGLGTCHCCDYFTIHGNTVLLIEETRLLETIENYKSKYDSMLEGNEKDRFIYGRIREENTLKVYGSLLVLCRWAAQHNELANFTSGKKHNFWLVVSDAEADDARFRDLDHIQSVLASLRSTLGSDLIGEVEVLTRSQFKSKWNP